MNYGDERVTSFLRSMEGENGTFLDSLERSAKDAGVPIIRPEMQSFLHVYLELLHPKKILEVGCAVGFSAMLMASYTEDLCTITTIESDHTRAEEARANFAASPWNERITLLEGDAGEILPALVKEEDQNSASLIGKEDQVRGVSGEAGSYDFIFMDAAKGQYPFFLPHVKRLLRSGGLLISDNVLQEGTILDSRYLLERRDRTIHSRMRDYLWTLKHSEDLITTIVPIGDGAAVSLKR